MNNNIESKRISPNLPINEPPDISTMQFDDSFTSSQTNSFLHKLLSTSHVLHALHQSHYATTTIDISDESDTNSDLDNFVPLSSSDKTHDSTSVWAQSRTPTTQAKNICTIKTNRRGSLN